MQHAQAVGLEPQESPQPFERLLGGSLLQPTEALIGVLQNFFWFQFHGHERAFSMPSERFIMTQSGCCPGLLPG